MALAKRQLATAAKDPAPVAVAASGKK